MNIAICSVYKPVDIVFVNLMVEIPPRKKGDFGDGGSRCLTHIGVRGWQDDRMFFLVPMVPSETAFAFSVRESFDSFASQFRRRLTMVVQEKGWVLGYLWLMDVHGRYDMV